MTFLPYFGQDLDSKIRWLGSWHMSAKADTGYPLSDRGAPLADAGDHMVKAGSPLAINPRPHLGGGVDAPPQTVFLGCTLHFFR